MTELTGRRALVTGANRGLGEQFVEALLARGVVRIYASARHIDALAPLVARLGEPVVPVQLDVTDPADIREAVRVSMTSTCSSRMPANRVPGRCWPPRTKAPSGRSLR